MKTFFYSLTLAIVASPALAGTSVPPPQVPEMSAGGAIAAVALVAGAVAIIRERSKRK